MILEKKSLLMALICSFAVLSLISTVSALQVDIDGDLPSEAKEGDIVEFEMIISGIPEAADFLSFETDLEPYGSVPLYNFTNFNVTTSSNHYVLNLSNGEETVLVKVKGKVPVIKEVVQVDKVTLIKLDSKTTGYAYYRLKFMDDEQNYLTDTDTKTFTISVPEIESFEAKLDTIDEPFFRNYLTDLFDKGLVSEANELADYLNSKDEGTVVPLYWTIAGLIIVLAAGIIIGIRIGNSDEDDDI